MSMLIFLTRLPVSPDGRSDHPVPDACKTRRSASLDARPGPLLSQQLELN